MTTKSERFLPIKSVWGLRDGAQLFAVESGLSVIPGERLVRRLRSVCGTYVYEIDDNRLAQFVRFDEPDSLSELFPIGSLWTTGALPDALPLMVCDHHQSGDLRLRDPRGKHYTWSPRMLVTPRMPGMLVGSHRTRNFWSEEFVEMFFPRSSRWQSDTPAVLEVYAMLSDPSADPWNVYLSTNSGPVTVHTLARYRRVLSNEGEAPSIVETPEVVATETFFAKRRRLTTLGKPQVNVTAPTTTTTIGTATALTMTTTMIGTAGAVPSASANERTTAMRIYVQSFDNDGYMVFTNKARALAGVGGTLVDNATPLELRRCETSDSTLCAELARGGDLWVDETDSFYEHVTIVFGAGAPLTTPVRSRKQRVKDQGKAVLTAAALGGALAVMDRAGDALLEAATKLKIPGLQSMLEDPMGREVVKIVMALIVHTAASQTDVLPKKEVLARVAEWQITMSSMKLIGPQLDVFVELAKSLVSVGEKLPEGAPSLGSGGARIFDNAVRGADVVESVQQRARS